MNTLSKAIVAGAAGTAVMTLFAMMGPMMGMPKMDAAAMLGGMMGGSLALGWMMHFAIGIIFACGYIFILNDRLPIVNNYVRGAVFGIIVFLFAQIMMAIMNGMGMMPAMPMDNMMMMAIGSLMGHIVFGAVLGIFIKKAA